MLARTVVPVPPSLLSRLCRSSSSSCGEMSESVPAWQHELIDIGANLLDSQFQGQYHAQRKHDADLQLVLERARKAGLTRIMLTAGTLEESRQALEMCEKHPGLLYTTVGVHPTRANVFESKGNDPDLYLQQLLQQARRGVVKGHVVAIGECGLDYDRLGFCSKEVQLRHFERHFYLAEQTGLPMFLHNRNTAGDFARQIRINRHRFGHGVAHSFTGSKQELDDLLDIDLYIGLNGCSLKSEANLDVAAAVPLDRLMIETDAPYCGIRPSHASAKHVRSSWPQSSRPSKHVPLDDVTRIVKGRCEPCQIRQVVECLAAIKGIEPEDVAAAALKNTKAVFFPDAQY